MLNKIQAETNILAEFDIYGINPKKECSIPMLVGNVRSVLVDEKGNKSSEIDMLAYFALTNKVPLIIGFKDLLSNFRVCFDQNNDDAFIVVEE